MSMIMTLAGENAFALQSQLHQLVADFKTKYGDLAVQHIDAQETSYEQVLEAITSLPFLVSRKLVVLRQPSTHKQFAEDIENLLAGIPETNDVILLEPKLDKRLSYYKILVKQTDFHNYPEIDISDLTRWLVETAKEQGGTLNPADARYLVERVGLNQQLLSNELVKILLYDPKISRQTIDLLTEQTPQSTIFQLLEAAFAGRAQRAMELYAEQRALKVEPPRLIALLTWQLHILAIIKTAGQRSADEIAKEAKLSPYVVSKNQSIARQLTLAQLRKMISDLLAIDVRTKSTSIDADEALQHYLLSLAED
jgi:DNA polymerase-3 subunit delta